MEYYDLGSAEAAYGDFFFYQTKENIAKEQCEDIKTFEIEQENWSFLEYTNC